MQVADFAVMAVPRDINAFSGAGKIGNEFQVELYLLMSTKLRQQNAHINKNIG